MKIFALIATSLALLNAGAIAQEPAPAAPQIKVTVDSVVTNYPLPSHNEKFVISCTGGGTVNNEKDEMQLEGNVHIKYGESFHVYAEKPSSRDQRMESIFPSLCKAVEKLTLAKAGVK